MGYDVMDKYVGQFYKSKRKQNKWTIQEVADRLRIPKETYYGYEVGRRSMPLKVMKTLGSIYGIDYISVLEDAQKIFIMTLRNEDGSL